MEAWKKHYHDGDEDDSGWEVWMFDTQGKYKGAAAVTSGELADHIIADHKLAALAKDQDDLLRRLAEWDHMQPPTADGPYWLARIAEMRARYDAIVSGSAEGES